MTATWLALAIVVAGAVALIIGSLTGGLPPGFGGDRLAGVVAMLALAVWIGPGVLRRYRGQGGTAVQHLAIWLAVIAVIALLYRFRDVLLPS